MKEKKYRDTARERSSVIIIKMLNVPGKTPIFAWRNDVFINPVVVNEKQETSQALFQVNLYLQTLLFPGCNGMTQYTCASSDYS